MKYRDFNISSSRVTDCSFLSALLGLFLGLVLLLLSRLLLILGWGSFLFGFLFSSLLSRAFLGWLFLGGFFLLGGGGFLLNLLSTSELLLLLGDSLLLLDDVLESSGFSLFGELLFSDLLLLHFVDGFDQDALVLEEVTFGSQVEVMETIERLAIEFSTYPW